ncbi:hypothetical protein KI387_008482, partial [Taxus chinensis]
MAEWIEEGGVKLYDMMVATTKPMALKSIVLLRILDIITTYGYGDDGETRVEHVGGDMFEGIPVADVVFLKFKDFIVCLNCARVEHVGSSMFEAIPTAHAVFLKFKDFIACLNCAGVEHMGDDMFEAIPTADAVFLK